MKQRRPPGFTPLQFLPLPDQHRHHYDEKINIKNCHDSAKLPDAGSPVERPGLLSTEFPAFHPDDFINLTAADFLMLRPGVHGHRLQVLAARHQDTRQVCHQNRLPEFPRACKRQRADSSHSCLLQKS